MNFCASRQPNRFIFAVKKIYMNVEISLSRARFSSSGVGQLCEGRGGWPGRSSSKTSSKQKDRGNSALTLGAAMGYSSGRNSSSSKTPPSYGESTGPRIMTEKCLRLSSWGWALMPGAGSLSRRWVSCCRRDRTHTRRRTGSGVTGKGQCRRLKRWCSSSVCFFRWFDGLFFFLLVLVFFLLF